MGAWVQLRAGELQPRPRWAPQGEGIPLLNDPTGAWDWQHLNVQPKVSPLVILSSILQDHGLVSIKQHVQYDHHCVSKDVNRTD